MESSALTDIGNIAAQGTVNKRILGNLNNNYDDMPLEAKDFVKEIENIVKDAGDIGIPMVKIAGSYRKRYGSQIPLKKIIGANAKLSVVLKHNSPRIKIVNNKAFWQSQPCRNTTIKTDKYQRDIGVDIGRVVAIVSEAGPRGIPIDQIAPKYERKYGESLDTKEAFATEKISATLKEKKISTHIEIMQNENAVNIAILRGLNTFDTNRDLSLKNDAPNKMTAYSKKKLAQERLEMIVKEASPNSVKLSDLPSIYKRKYGTKLDAKKVFSVKKLSSALRNFQCMETFNDDNGTIWAVWCDPNLSNDDCDIAEVLKAVGLIENLVKETREKCVSLSSIPGEYLKEYKKILHKNRYFGTSTQLASTLTQYSKYVVVMSNTAFWCFPRILTHGENLDSDSKDTSSFPTEQTSLLEFSRTCAQCGIQRPCCQYQLRLWEKKEYKGKKPLKTRNGDYSRCAICVPQKISLCSFCNLDAVGLCKKEGCIAKRKEAEDSYRAAENARREAREAYICQAKKECKSLYQTVFGVGYESPISYKSLPLKPLGTNDSITELVGKYDLIFCASKCSYSSWYERDPRRKDAAPDQDIHRTARGSLDLKIIEYKNIPVLAGNYYVAARTANKGTIDDIRSTEREKQSNVSVALPRLGYTREPLLVEERTFIQNKMEMEDEPWMAFPNYEEEDEMYQTIYCGEGHEESDHLLVSKSKLVSMFPSEYSYLSSEWDKDPKVLNEPIAHPPQSHHHCAVDNIHEQATISVLDEMVPLGLDPDTVYFQVGKEQMSHRPIGVTRHELFRKDIGLEKAEALMSSYENVKDCWICTKLGMPEDIGLLIRQFVTPPPVFYLKKGDVILYYPNWDNKQHDFIKTFIFRKRREE